MTVAPVYRQIHHNRKGPSLLFYWCGKTEMSDSSELHQSVLRALLYAMMELVKNIDSADISEGRGSRVRIALQDVRAVLHRPHPQKETDRGAVMSMRRFIIEAGIEP
jgi:hypothetical protein